MTTQIVYRLLSGKISRPNAEGQNEVHKAPYDFVPTPSELEGNRHRMRPVGTLQEGDRKITVEPGAPANPPADTQKGLQPIDDIRRLNVRDACAYLSEVTTEDALDTLFLQESENTPRVRQTVMVAIEARRDELKALVAEALVAGAGAVSK